MTVLRQILLLAVLTVVGFAIFVGLFLAGIAASVSILFYRGVALALVAAIAAGIIALWPARRTSDSSLPVAAAALSLSFNLCFLVLLPVTVDRSISVYLLSTIEQRQESGITSAQLERSFVDDYVVRMGAIDRRIDEQRRSGNVTVDGGGKVHLTLQGERFMSFSRVIARLFGTDPRFVSGGTPPAPHRGAR